jgi:putative (di)nucleoside polyphosphate hydrolase
MMKKKQGKENRALTFRAGVGALILNEKDQVLAFERKEIPGSWQFPQGGLKRDEIPLEAVVREVLEETGIEANDLELLTTFPRWLAYELPEDARTRKLGRGQVLRWFLFRFKGENEAITLGNQKEFRAWKWTSIDELVPIVVSFKKPMYQELAEYLKLYL